jgi:hypothetical protein
LQKVPKYLRVLLLLPLPVQVLLLPQQVSETRSEMFLGKRGNLLVAHFYVFSWGVNHLKKEVR